MTNDEELTQQIIEVLKDTGHRYDTSGNALPLEDLVIIGIKATAAALLPLLKQRKTEWVACSERLPEVNVKVIVARPNQYSGKVDVLTAYLLHSGEERIAYGRLGSYQYLTGNYWVLPAIVPFDNITHWLPIPQPPQ